MIECNSARVSSLALSFVDSSMESPALPIEEVNYQNLDEETFLIDLLVKPFAQSFHTYEFFHEVDLQYNVIFNVAKHLFQGERLVFSAELIATHLKSVSTHHGIKSGELLVGSFEDIRIGDTFYDAIGIYKFETRQRFLSTNSTSKGLEYRFVEGLGGKRPEKAALIILTEEPYTVLCIDNNSPSTAYWIDSFLNLSPKDDSANLTSEYMNLTKRFIVENVQPDSHLSRADQIQLLNQSIEYFKENSTFKKDEFEDIVFGKEGLIEDFRAFEESTRLGDPGIRIDEFEISKFAVKKQARIFKSVLKLDKNFHVYIHGNRELIERGTEPDGRKFYKLYFNSES